MSGASESVLEALARRYSSTTPSAPTSSTSPVPPSRPARARAGVRPRHASGRRSSGRSTRSPALPRTSATTASASSPPTTSDVHCSPSSTSHPRGRPTTRGSSSSTRAPKPSTPTGNRAARETTAILRSAAGRDPYDRDLSDLVGELATQSETFRTHWAAHNVRFHTTAVKRFRHPVVGELSLSFNRLDVAADRGLTLFTYAAEPGSPSQEALNLLGSWAATIDLAQSARTTES